MLVFWNAAIYLDSSALTAGTVEAADQEQREQASAGDPRAQGLANYPGMPAAQPGGEQDAGTSQDEPPTPAE